MGEMSECESERSVFPDDLTLIAVSQIESRKIKSETISMHVLKYSNRIGVQISSTGLRNPKNISTTHMTRYSLILSQQWQLLVKS